MGGIGLCTIIKPFMHFYVRSSLYGEVWRYVPLLLASAVFSALAAYCGSMYGALKKSVNNMATTLTAAIVNLIVNYIAILLVGLWGAMIGTVTAYIVLTFVRLIDVKRYVNIGIEWEKLIINSILIMIQAIVMSVASVSIGVVTSAITVVMFIGVNRKEIVQAVMLFKRGGKKNV